MNGHFRDLLTSKIKCDQSNIAEGWELTSNCRWIFDATTIHLATHWHPESLVYFLALDVQDFCVSFDSYSNSRNQSKSLLHRVVSIKFHKYLHCKFGTTWVWAVYENEVFLTKKLKHQLIQILYFIQNTGITFWH